MRRVYDIIVSGDRYQLYFYEIMSLLKAYSIDFKIIKSFFKVLRIETGCCPQELVSILLGASSVQRILIEKTVVDTLQDLKRVLPSLEWGELRETPFKVSTLKIGERKDNVRLSSIIPLVVKSIMNKLNNQVCIDIKYPKARVVIVSLSSSKILVGVEMLSLRGDRFRFRNPKMKVFKHPSMLTTRDARLLYNLALVKSPEDTKFLDPFCGTGSILIESAIEGSYSIGVEIRRDLIKGAKNNIKEFSVYGNIDLIHADSTLLPLRENSFESVGTDPPYGRLSSTYRRKNCELLEKFIREATQVLKRKGKIVIMYNYKYRRCILEEFRKRRIKVDEEYSFIVHNGLTRIVIMARIND